MRAHSSSHSTVGRANGHRSASVPSLKRGRKSFFFQSWSCYFSHCSYLHRHGYGHFWLGRYRGRATTSVLRRSSYIDEYSSDSSNSPPGTRVSTSETYGLWQTFMSLALTAYFRPRCLRYSGGCRHFLWFYQCRRRLRRPSGYNASKKR